MRETPSIQAYTTTATGYSGLPTGNAAFFGEATAGCWNGDEIDTGGPISPRGTRRLMGFRESAAAATMDMINVTIKNQQETPQMARRIVQVYIADPNENVPLEDSILFKGDQKMTDLTDQELFFEIDIKTILEHHNAKRVKLTDKKVKERVEHLEPAKIRDLKMVVVTVANF